MSEQGGRYQRTTAGLIGAMLITLVAIAAFVAFRALNRDELETGPEAIDYLEQVGLAQEAGLEVVYPRTLPTDWVATSVDIEPGERPAWGMGMLTRGERFVGIRQEDESLDDLLTTYVDEDTTALPEVEVDASVAQTWQVFEDQGGDVAYAADMGDQTVLVYGSGSEADLIRILGDLTTDPVSGSAG